MLEIDEKARKKLAFNLGYLRGDFKALIAACEDYAEFLLKHHTAVLAADPGVRFLGKIAAAQDAVETNMFQFGNTADTGSGVLDA